MSRLSLCLWKCQNRMLLAALLEYVQVHAPCARSPGANDVASVGPEPIVQTHAKGRSGKFTSYFVLFILFPENQQGGTWQQCCSQRTRKIRASSTQNCKRTAMMVTNLSSRTWSHFLAKTALGAFPVLSCQASPWDTWPSPSMCIIGRVSWLMAQKRMPASPTFLERCTTASPWVLPMHSCGVVHSLPWNPSPFQPWGPWIPTLLISKWRICMMYSNFFANMVLRACQAIIRWNFGMVAICGGGSLL